MHLNMRPSIDWEQVKTRLRESQGSTGAGLAATDEATLAKVYLERTRQFASRSSNRDAQAGAPALVFAVGEERLCIAISSLVEVLSFDRCSPIPNARPELLGAVNVRGHICSVLDLPRILGLPSSEPPRSGYIALVHGARGDVGLRVDRVDQIEKILADEPDRQMCGSAAWSSQYLLYRTAGGVGVLNLDAVFSHPVFLAAGA